MIVSKKKKIKFSELRQWFIEHGRSGFKDELEYQLLQRYFDTTPWSDNDRIEIIFYAAEWIDNQHNVPVILFEAEEGKYVELKATAFNTFGHYLYREAIGFWDQSTEYITEGQQIVSWIDEFINYYTDIFLNPFPVPEEEVPGINFLRLLRKDMFDKYYLSNVIVKLPGTKNGAVVISVPEAGEKDYIVFKSPKDCFAKKLTEEVMELTSIAYGDRDYFNNTYFPLSLGKYLNLEKENDDMAEVYLNDLKTESSATWVDSTANAVNGTYYNTTRTVPLDYTIGTATAISLLDPASDVLSTRIGLVEEKLNNMTKKEEKKMMNFDFGIMDKTDIRLSPVGLAMKNGDNKYVAYDKNKRDIIDVDGLTFSADGVLMKMPVAIEAIEVGDLVLHQGVPVYVIQVNEKTLTVMDSTAGEVREISLLKSLFGFNYATKIVSFMDFGTPAPDAKNPFGNLMPLLLMRDKGSKSGDMMKTMMLMGMCGGQVSDGIMFGEMNPYLMMMLMEDK